VHYHFVRERVLSGEVELRYVPTDRQTADIFTKPLGLDKLRKFSGALGLRHLDVPNLRGRNDQADQGGRKEQEPQELKARDVERRKKVEPDEAEPESEKADDYESRSDGADDSERGSRSESAGKRRCDSETLNQPRPKRTGETQRMRQRHDSKKAEKGRCRPEGSKRRMEQIEEHVRGRPKDRTTNMQSEIRGRAKTRRHGKPCNTKTRVTPETRSHGNPCDTEFRVFQKTRNSVWNGMPCDFEEHEFPCVYGKTRKHGNLCDTESRVNRRKHGKPCEPTKTRKPVWRLKDAEIPNSRNSTTCSKTSGTRPELRTSKSPNFRKGGDDQRPIQNRILE
jgi:hypothetical protein